MSDNQKYITLTTENFAHEVLKSSIPVIVDFWAPWCGPCRVMNPVIADLAADFEGIVKVGKVNIDEWEDLASKYRIEAIPSILFFNQGEVVDRSGLVSKERLQDKVNTLLTQENVAV